MLLRYFSLAGIFNFFCGRTKRPAISSQKRGSFENRRDIFWSVLSSAVFALSGVMIIHLWHLDKTAIYSDISERGIWYFLLSFPLALIIHDTYFYWTHRLFHRPGLFHKFHLAHHESKVPSAWTSFAFHPLEALVQAIILPLIVIFIPLHWIILISFLSFMSLTGLLNHLGYELYPAFLENRFGIISATHHQVHHSKVKMNFGLYFTWWDLFMDTEGKRR
jgi:sterol desaturase/sphingolipid hydroxylase (fatty acid hydroxylase superfamily)